MKPNFKRRDFLRLTTLSAGSLLLSPYYISAKDFKSLSAKASPKKIVIIGAGLSGLCAALELTRAGHSVTILEAQSKPGGRVRTMRENLAEGFSAELGAARIPDNHEWTLKYIKDFGLQLAPFYPTTLDSMHLAHDKLIRIKPGESPLAGVFSSSLNDKERNLTQDKLFEQVMAKKLRLTFDREHWPVPEAQDLDNVTAKQFLKNEGWSPEVIDALEFKPFENASMLEVIRIMGNGHGSKTQSKIVGGNDQLPKAFASRLSDNIQYGAVAFRIEQTATEVHVMYKQAGEIKKISGDKLISAIPYSVLRNIEVSPAFSSSKTKVIKQMGYASLSRATFQVKNRYWREQGLSGFGYSDVGAEIWHPTFDRDGKRGLLQMYLQGQSSQFVANMTSTQQENFLINQMNRVFPGLRQNLESVHLHCWENDPYALGAVRLINPGQVVEFHHDLFKTEGNVHFAGEHTSTYTGYMNGALESGIRVAKEINEG